MDPTNPMTKLQPQLKQENTTITSSQPFEAQISAQLELRVEKMIAAVIRYHYKNLNTSLPQISLATNANLSSQLQQHTRMAGVKEILPHLEILIDLSYLPNKAQKNELKFLQKIIQMPQQLKEVIAQAEMATVHAEIQQIATWLCSFIYANLEGNTNDLKAIQPKIDGVLEILLNIFAEKGENVAAVHNLYFIGLIKSKQTGWTDELKFKWVRIKKQFTAKGKLKIEELIRKRIKHLENFNQNKITGPLQHPQPEKAIDNNPPSRNRSQKQKRPQAPMHLQIQRNPTQVILNPEHKKSLKTKPSSQKKGGHSIKHLVLFQYLRKYFQMHSDPSTDQVLNTLINYQMIFMKDFIKKLITRAVFRNPRYQSPYFGTETKYFHPQNPNVANLLISKNLIEKHTSFKNFNLQLPQKAYKLLTYPSKMKSHQILKNNEYAVESKQINQLLDNLQHIGRNSQVKNLKHLKQIAEQGTKGERVDIEEQSIFRTKRLKITKAMIGDILFEDYSWIFAAQRSLYH